MRKIIIIGLLCLGSAQLIASGPGDTSKTNIAGTYFGIMPQIKKHFVGIRYQVENMMGSSEGHSHAGNPTQTYFHTWNIIGKISPHKRVSVYIIAPIHYFLQKDSSTSREIAGPGDIFTLIQYQLIRTKDPTKKTRHSFILGGGIKLPTGRYNAYDTKGFYERNMQPGTGSWDALLSTQYTLSRNGWGLNTEINARISTTNPDNYFYGHKINTSIKGFYWGKGDKISVLASGGLIYDWAGKDIYLRQSIPNSGGHIIKATASIDLYMKRWAIGTEFKVPLYANMSGGALKPSPQIMSQLMFMF